MEINLGPIGMRGDLHQGLEEGLGGAELFLGGFGYLRGGGRGDWYFSFGNVHGKGGLGFGFDGVAVSLFCFTNVGGGFGGRC